MELDPREELSGLAYFAQSAKKDAALERTLNEIKAALDNASLPDRVLSVHASRLRDVLLEQRSPAPDHVRRFCLDKGRLRELPVFGEAHLVARITLGSGAARKVIPCYVPARHRARMPLFDRCLVRALSLVQAQVDPSESVAFAVRVVALGRVLDV